MQQIQRSDWVVLARKRRRGFERRSGFGMEARTPSCESLCKKKRLLGRKIYCVRGKSESVTRLFYDVTLPFSSVFSSTFPAFSRLPRSLTCHGKPRAHCSKHKAPHCKHPVHIVPCSHIEQQRYEEANSRRKMNATAVQGGQKRISKC